MERHVFICKSALLQREENISKARDLCVSQQLQFCRRTGTSATWRGRLSFKSIKHFRYPGYFFLKARMCVHETKMPTECPAMLVLVLQCEVRKLHSYRAVECEGRRASAVPDGSGQLFPTCIKCPSVPPPGKISSTLQLVALASMSGQGVLRVL